MFEIKNIDVIPRTISGLGQVIESGQVVDLEESNTVDNILFSAYDEIVTGINSDIYRMYDGGELSKAESLAKLDTYVDSQESHPLLDQLVHDISESHYAEPVLNTKGFPTSFTIYTDSGKASKVREWNYSYTNGLPSSVIVNQYDSDGSTVLETMTYDSFSFNEGFPVSYEGAFT